MVNCVRPAPISIATVGTVQIVNNLSTLILSKMFGASSKYRDRATAVWHGSHAHVETHGFNAEGEFFIATPHRHLLRRVPAPGAFKDGVDLGGEIPNVVSRWANVESQELNTPVRYLFRRAVPDSGGPGKYRGGVCHEYAFSAQNTGGNPLGVVLFGKGTRAPMSLGLFGGLPGCNVSYGTFHHANVDELPDSLAAIRAEESVEQSFGHLELHEGDVQYVRFMGGGGYGDPIDRDPQAVLRDIGLGLVGAQAARDIYGVVAVDGGLDEQRHARAPTADPLRAGRRRSRRGARKAGEVTATAMPIGEYLQRIEDGSTQCTWCGEIVAAAGEDWKEHAKLRRSPVSAAGPQRSAGHEFNLIEAFCPNCGTMLDVDSPEARILRCTIASSPGRRRRPDLRGRHPAALQRRLLVRRSQRRGGARAARRPARRGGGMHLRGAGRAGQLRRSRPA